MTFLNDTQLWPVDLTGENVFLVKAVQEIGRGLRFTETRLPPCLYEYSFGLPRYELASEDDKFIATDIIQQNVSGEHIEVEEKSFYSESIEGAVKIVNYQITKKQWDLAEAIIPISRSVKNENIANSIAITSAIFTGVAMGHVIAVERSINRTGYRVLPSGALNIDRKDSIRARLALGQIDKTNPMDTDTRGVSHIFLERKSFDRWKGKTGRQVILVELALQQLLSLAKSGYKLKDNQKKVDLLSKPTIRYHLDDEYKEILWERLPDVPFKLPGIRASK